MRKQKKTTHQTRIISGFNFPSVSHFSTISQYSMISFLSILSFVLMQKRMTVITSLGRCSPFNNCKMACLAALIFSSSSLLSIILHKSSCVGGCSPLAESLRLCMSTVQFMVLKEKPPRVARDVRMRKNPIFLNRKDLNFSYIVFLLISKLRVVKRPNWPKKKKQKEKKDKPGKAFIDVKNT